MAYKIRDGLGAFVRNMRVRNECLKQANAFVEEHLNLSEKIWLAKVTDGFSKFIKLSEVPYNGVGMNALRNILIVYGFTWVNHDVPLNGPAMITIKPNAESIDCILRLEQIGKSVLSDEIQEELKADFSHLVIKWEEEHFLDSVYGVYS